MTALRLPITCRGCLSGSQCSGWATWAACRRRASPAGATRSSASTSTPTRSPWSPRAAARSSRSASATSIAEQVAAGRLRATTDAARGRRRRPTSRSCASAPRRRRAATSTTDVPRAGRPTRSATALRDRDDRYTVVAPLDHAARRPATRSSCRASRRPRARRRRGLRPGVNPEFLREGSSVRDFFDPPKTVIGQVRRRAAATPVAALYEGLPGPVYRVPIARRRDDQVRRQRLPRAEGRLRQRDRRGLQGARARQPRGDGHLRRRHQAQHLAGLPQAGLRLRRLVPAQGPARDHAPRAPGRHRRCRSWRASCPPTRAQIDRVFRAIEATGKRRGRACSASPSRPAPTTCARARWSPSPSGSSGAASS